MNKIGKQEVCSRRQQKLVCLFDAQTVKIQFTYISFVLAKSLKLVENAKQKRIVYNAAGVSFWRKSLDNYFEMQLLLFLIAYLYHKALGAQNAPRVSLAFKKSSRLSKN